MNKKPLFPISTRMITALMAASILLLPSIIIASPSSNPAAFYVGSSAFSDGEIIPKKYSGNFNGCTGQNISPPLFWRNIPAEARSFAVVLFDADGGRGLGVTHWIVYGIPRDMTALPENAGEKSDATFIGGINMRSSLSYAGPCPRAGDRFHHYLFLVYALDLPVDALQPGLDFIGLKSAIAGHIVGGSSVVGRVERKL